MDHLLDRWLSTKEIYTYFGVSSDTVYRWVATHEMLFHRMGCLFKFKISEIDAWDRAGGATPNSRKTIRK